MLLTTYRIPRPLHFVRAEPRRWERTKRQCLRRTTTPNLPEQQLRTFWHSPKGSDKDHLIMNSWGEGAATNSTEALKRRASGTSWHRSILMTIESCSYSHIKDAAKLSFANARLRVGESQPKFVFDMQHAICNRHDTSHVQSPNVDVKLRGTGHLAAGRSES